jgi:glyoxylase-like metal-dependent hydrolase (beta-lactamase superfamily II)
MAKICLGLLLICALVSISQAHTSLIKGAHKHAQQQDVVIKTEKVAGNVYVLFGQGGNIGVSAGADGILMIDDQFERLADKIKAALKELGSDRPRFVFNTHWHGDHTGGNPVFGKDSVIVAHENVRKRLSSTQNVLGETVKPMTAVGLPMITYGQGLSIHFNGEEVRAVHFPNGHTDGDTILFFTGSNVVHLGDDFFRWTLSVRRFKQRRQRRRLGAKYQRTHQTNSGERKINSRTRSDFDHRRFEKLSPNDNRDDINRARQNENQITRRYQKRRLAGKIPRMGNGFYQHGTLD